MLLLTKTKLNAKKKSLKKANQKNLLKLLIQIDIKFKKKFYIL